MFIMAGTKTYSTFSVVQYSSVQISTGFGSLFSIHVSAHLVSHLGSNLFDQFQEFYVWSAPSNRFLSHCQYEFSTKSDKNQCVGGKPTHNLCDIKKSRFTYFEVKFFFNIFKTIFFQMCWINKFSAISKFYFCSSRKIIWDGMKNDCENLRIWRITPCYIQMS